MLLKAMIGKAKASGKPAGLLVDKTNPKAAALYHSLGFIKRLQSVIARRCGMLRLQ